MEMKRKGRPLSELVVEPSKVVDVDDQSSFPSLDHALDPSTVGTLSELHFEVGIESGHISSHMEKEPKTRTSWSKNWVNWRIFPRLLSEPSSIIILEYHPFVTSQRNSNPSTPPCCSFFFPNNLQIQFNPIQYNISSIYQSLVF